MTTHGRCWGAVLLLAVVLGEGCANRDPSPGYLEVPTQVASKVALPTSGRTAFQKLGGEFRVANERLSAAVAAGGRLSVAPHDLSTRPGPTAACSFTTVGIARGHDLSATATPAFVDEQGRVVIARGESVETIENGDDGLEQRWQFATAPRGSGALQVHVSVTGCNFVGSSSGGMHFRSARSTAGGVVYGSAWWVDATGSRTRLAATFDRGEVILTVPASTLEQSAYPAQIDPILSAESDVDAPVTVAIDQPGIIAAGDGQYAVLYDSSPSPRIGILSAAGVLLTPINGVPILTEGNYFSPDAMAFNGQYYLAVGVGAPAVPNDSSTAPGGDLYGLRIATDGTPLDATPILLASGNDHNDAPSLASDGNGFLLGWTAYNDIASYDFAVETLLPKSDGTLTISELSPLPLANNTGQPPSSVQTTFNGANYVVAYVDQPLSVPHLRHVTLSPQGTVIAGPLAFSTPGYSSSSASGGQIASGGNQTLLVAGAAFLYDQALSPVGSYVAFGSDSTSSAFAYNGTNFQLVWPTTNTFPTGISTLQVGPDGTPIEAMTQSSPIISTGTNPPQLACQNGQCLVVFNGLGVRLDATGTALDDPPLQIVGFAPTQDGVLIAGGTSNYLVEWGESSLSYRFARASLTGSMLDPGGILIPGKSTSASTGTSYSTYAPLSALGDNFFASWLTFVPSANIGSPTTVNLNLSRISSAGVALDAQPHLLATGSTPDASAAADLTCSASVCLAVWTIDDGGSNNQVLAARVGADGVPLDSPPIVLQSGLPGGGSVQVATDSTQFLALWATGTSPSQAVRISFAGNVLDATPIAIPIALPTSIVGNATTFLISALAGPTISSVRVTDSGQLLDSTPFLISGTALSTGQATAAPAADGFLVAWPDAQSNLNGTFVTKDGATSCPFLFEQGVDGTTTPALALGSDGKLLLGYGRFKSDPGYFAERILTRTVELTASDMQPTPEAGCTSVGGSGGSAGAAGSAGNGGESGQVAGSSGASQGGTGTTGGAAAQAGTSSETSGTGGQTSSGDASAGASASAGSGALGAGAVGGNEAGTSAGQAGTNASPPASNGSGCSFTGAPSQRGSAAWIAMLMLLGAPCARRRLGYSASRRARRPRRK